MCNRVGSVSPSPGLFPHGIQPSVPGPLPDREWSTVHNLRELFHGIELTHPFALDQRNEKHFDLFQAFLNGPQRTIYDDAFAFLMANSSNLGYLPPGNDEAVRNALVDPNAFRGNRMAQLKQATDTLRARIDELVTKEAAATAKAITAKKTEIQTGTDFQNATPEAQQAALSAIDARIAAVQQAREIPHIREARTSFEVTQYPAILDKLAASARPAPQPGPDGAGAAVPRPTPTQPVETISIKTITVPGTHGVLTSSDDVEKYVAALRDTLLATLNDGKRISL